MNDRDAEDVLQDVFYELIQAYRMMKPAEQMTAWLYRVARNRITDLWRRRKAVSLSEPAHLRLWFGPVHWWGGDTIAVDLPAGPSTVSRDGRYEAVRILAWDAAANRSSAVIAKIARS